MGTTFADINSGTSSIEDTDLLDRAVVLDVRDAGPDRRQVTVRYEPYGEVSLRLTVTGKPTRPFMAAVRAAYDRKLSRGNQS